jgi:hypothetical protein
MFDGMRKIIERRIMEAMEKGEFDNLPGKGQPLKLDDDAGVPPELRLAYKILKNSGCPPPEIQLKKEIMQIEDLLAGIDDELEKYRQIKKLNMLVTKLNAMRQRPINFEEAERYYPEVVARIKTSTSKKKDDEEGNADGK